MKTPHPERLSSSLEILEARVAPAGVIVAAGAGLVSISINADAATDLVGTYETHTDTFSPFVGYKGGISVAMGDLDGDGNDELITAMAKGTKATVRIWQMSGAGRVGSLLDEFVPFDNTTNSGVSIAAGDLDGDATDELIIGAGPGGTNLVRIFGDTNADGKLSDDLLDTFSPFPVSFKGGVKVAADNVNNTGGAEVVAGTWTAGGTVAIYTDTNASKTISDDGGAPLETFQPFGANYKSGINVAAGIIQNAGGGGAEVIVGTAKGASKVLIFADANASGTVSDDAIFDTLLPKGSGAAIAAGDSDLSGTFVEVIVGPAAGSGANVRIYDDTNDPGALLSDEPLANAFNAFSKNSGGLNLAFGKVQSAAFAFNGFPQSIPDSSTLSTSIFIPSNVGIIRDLDISLSIFHSFDGDLDVTLTHVATGFSVVLFQDVGGSNEGFIIRLNDEAGTDIGTATNPKADGAISGTFNPEAAALLSAFDGNSAGGEWRLTITDDTANDFGTLFGWTLHFTL